MFTLFIDKLEGDADSSFVFIEYVDFLRVPSFRFPPLKGDILVWPLLAPERAYASPGDVAFCLI